MYFTVAIGSAEFFKTTKSHEARLCSHHTLTALRAARKAQQRQHPRIDPSTCAAHAPGPGGVMGMTAVLIAAPQRLTIL